MCNRFAETHRRCATTLWKHIFDVQPLCGSPKGMEHISDVQPQRGSTSSMCFHKVEGALRKHIFDVQPLCGSPKGMEHIEDVYSMCNPKGLPLRGNTSKMCFHKVEGASRFPEGASALRKHILCISLICKCFHKVEGALRFPEGDEHLMHIFQLSIIFN
jgi:hypothetical protein